ncbi:proteasome assembly chaperone 2 [Nomia melanderi]|uniref:proteasome assembly chaperone 2 n=1 Tax=Nomia melanderi TaxID=2448451 RepID=UPI0013045103|nr:proteasome assembly chaperone 2 [Nomia melanderi]XP_031831396.1 proteasome assembly chaperone 2 [Nomia melanderi]XP_031831397.1 proteasome assembly chaperone 2 [Nomia melanderi]XP_031831398.1 proteasome assembly chaperone 2 [Nomia melanderi]XP_031831399.1 proteasome assembly chaperone 2 [Nomia melanderi]XP_031831400.1 proteasome assembly chaperone 2 [Nomia melanderi]XP_031831401.1 proteasome assembly chaperone 2 [Nomia melanderi]XP_031831402.1 proteasome assembly chaperone 2 [Nomia meland
MIKLLEEINLEDYTLILPSVAVGNVGQLSIDLLISTLNLYKIGSMWSSIFLPICGYDPYNKNTNSLCTAADFYLGTTHKIVLLQLRSPHVGNSTDFFKELAEFIQQKKISKIIILTSSYDYERSERSDSSLRYLTTDDSLMNNKTLLESLKWKRYTRKTLMEPTENFHIPGGGFANGLYNYLKSVDIPCTVLFCYCSEGDNISDALTLVKGLNQWLNILETTSNIDINVRYPPSWEYLFGNPPASELY